MGLPSVGPYWSPLFYGIWPDFSEWHRNPRKKISRVEIQNISWGSIAPDPCRCLCIQHWLFQTSSPFILDPHLIITEFISIVPFKVPHPNEEFSVQNETQCKNSNFTRLMISGSTYYAYKTSNKTSGLSFVVQRKQRRKCTEKHWRALKNRVRSYINSTM